MARLSAGEAGALDEIIRRYGAAMFRFILAQIGDPEQAGDLLQEVFVAVFEGRARYRASGQFRGWLYKIARNLLRKARRERDARARRESGLGHLLARGWPALPDETPERREQVRRLLTVLGELEEDDRVLVELHLLEKRTFRQIAADLGVSPSTVKARLDRTLGVLQRRVLGG